MQSKIWIGVLALLVSCGLVLASYASDPSAAEAQYRIARRLVAEGSPQAVEALRKVVELDPAGALADDALLDESQLVGLPRWPEGLGRLDQTAIEAARPPLNRLMELFTEADRLSEARYFHALLSLEPLPGRDRDRARLDLLALATDPKSGQWARAARYTLAWLAWQEGDESAARAGFQRLLVDAPTSDATARARVALARMEIRDGNPARAAIHLQAAIDARVDAKLYPQVIREFAMEQQLDGKVKTPNAVKTPTRIRAAAGIAAMPQGGAHVGDRKGGSVASYRADGTVVHRWVVDDIEHVDLSPSHGLIAADDEWVYRLDEARPARQIASQGDFAPVAGIAAQGSGGIFVIDRKGDRVGRIDPGATAPRAIFERRGAKLIDLAWDRDRLIVLSSKTKRVFAVSADGREIPLKSPEFERPTSVTVNAAGQIAVLDTRAETIVVLAPSGEALGTIAYKGLGISKPESLRYGLDGALHVHDDATEAWVRLQ